MTYQKVGPAGIALPVVSGNWGGNVAGKNLCIALAQMGLIVDSTNSTTSSRYPTAVLGTTGLIGYWRLGELSSASPAADSHVGGTNNPGSYVGSPVVNVASFAGTQPDTAITLDGSTQTVTIPHNASLNVGDLVSVEAWVKRSATQGTQQSLASKDSGAWCFRIGPGNTINLGSSGVADIVNSTVTITDTTTWHYVAFTKNGATVHLYLDGNDVTGTVTNTTLVNNTSALLIGDNNGFSEKYSGSIDEVALYNVELSAATIAAHWAAR